MTKYSIFPLASLMAVQAAGQLMLAHAGLSVEQACAGTCAILAVMPFGSKSIRRFYRRAMSPLPRLIRA